MHPPTHTHTLAHSLCTSDIAFQELYHTTPSNMVVIRQEQDIVTMKCSTNQLKSNNEWSLSRNDNNNIEITSNGDVDRSRFGYTYVLGTSSGRFDLYMDTMDNSFEVAGIYDCSVRNKQGEEHHRRAALVMLGTL